tara:strand:+ start:7453 stop:9675 length:2223 start_codon:yes stop_codon:yes gene_type:complete
MLQKLGFLPGFNKQVTATGAESQWTDGQNVRFRYGTPEKIGGWNQLGESKLTGVARKLHHFVNSASTKFAAIGTNRILYAYSGGVFYDIHPLVNPSGTALTNCFSTTNNDREVTITFSGTTTFQAGDIILFGDASTFSSITNSNFTAADFADKKFMVTSVPTSTSITITMPSAETGSGATLSGGITFFQYYHVGPAEQLGAFGWGISLWGGTVLGAATTTLDGAITGTSGGNNSSATEITLTSVTGFPTTGTNFIQIGTEEISYTGITGTKLTGIGRGARGTTATTHSNGATVTNTSQFTGWGSPAANTDKVTDPGLWSLDNIGAKLIALIVGGSAFEWDGDAANATSTRATLIAGAPTASRDMLVSTTDRHLIFFGTEKTIGDTTTQDDMFIRFSSQENINDYTPTAINTAGTQRLADGSRIIGAVVGRDAIYVWTDTALFTMRFVGGDFTFAFAQVGTNCGLIGKNAAVEVDGAAYWMSDNGFFKYTGKLESMDCLVEDFVYDDLNTTSNQLIYAGINNLFGEVVWFYPTSTSNVNNRAVFYSYLDSTLKRPIWFTNDSSLFARSTWEDSAVFGLPHGTKYNADDDNSFDVTGNTDGTTIYFEHETGVNQLEAGAVTTAIPADIVSGDFDITQKVVRGAATNLGDLRGDGENIMRVSRIIPDFIAQQGNTIVQLDLRNYPNNTSASSSLGPFTITSATTKVDTRARARAVALTIKNTAVDTSWKLGTFRLDIHAGGRR